MDVRGFCAVIGVFVALVCCGDNPWKIPDFDSDRGGLIVSVVTAAGVVWMYVFFAWWTPCFGILYFVVIKQKMAQF